LKDFNFGFKMPDIRNGRIPEMTGR